MGIWDTDLMQVQDPYPYRNELLSDPYNPTLLEVATVSLKLDLSFWVVGDDKVSESNGSDDDCAGDDFSADNGLLKLAASSLECWRRAQPPRINSVHTMGRVVVRTKYRRKQKKKDILSTDQKSTVEKRSALLQYFTKHPQIRGDPKTLFPTQTSSCGGLVHCKSCHDREGSRGWNISVNRLLLLLLSTLSPDYVNSAIFFHRRWRRKAFVLYYVVLIIILFRRGDDVKQVMAQRGFCIRQE